MSNIRVYLEAEKINYFIEIKEKEIIHKIRDVLRIKEDEELYIFDGEGNNYLYQVRDIKKSSILIEKKYEQRGVPPSTKVILGFPLIKEEKIDFILQKATELGVSVFSPFICERSVRTKSSCAKLQRWKKIVIEATRQCERLWLPQIEDVLTFKEIIRGNYQVKLVTSLKGETLEKIIDKECKEIFVIVGPEGDFSPQEYEYLKENNFQFIKLSKNILRVETASIFAVGLVNYLLI